MNITQKHRESGDTPGLNSVFENIYIDVRHREKREYSDHELMYLPDIDPAHIHFKEWQVRKHTSQRLVAYLAKKNKPIKILEIGCGNGWLSSKLASISDSMVTGLDINGAEILQAKRVFKNENLEFRHENFDPAMFSAIKFDIILFAASVQYFSSIKNILQKALSCLRTNGEVHIMDSPFYQPGQIVGARQRAQDYFKKLNAPEMAAYYFYHSLNELKQFNFRILVNPTGIINRITKKDAFYWLSITN